MSEQFSNTEQALIERLRRAPQPELPVEAREIIRARMMDALNRPPLPASRPTLLRPSVVMIAVAVGAMLIAGGILFALSQQNQNPVLPTNIPVATVYPTLTETSQPTSTTTATDTAAPTVTSAPATAAPLVVSSPVLTNTSTSTPTVEVTPSPTATVNAVMVIQGPVESIDGNLLIIYGIPIQVDPNNPILKTIEVGDVLRIEGNQTGAPVIIISPTIIAVTLPPTASTPTGSNATGSNSNPPSSGQVWQDDGTCDHPPPDWAPANGWRRRCQGQINNTPSNNGNGNSGNNGNGDGGNNGNGNGNGNGGGKPNKP